MTGSALRGFRIAGMAAAGAVVAAAAGCASPAGSPAASSATAPTVTASSPAAAPGAVPSGGGAATAGGAAGGGSNGCSTGDLKVKAGTSQGAAGSSYLPVDFTNTSSAACTLYGFPGVSLATGSPATQVGAAATRSTNDTATMVTLAPGRTANALLRIADAGNYPHSTCSPANTTYLRVYPPDQTEATLVPFQSTGCTSGSVKLLTIGAVKAGSGQ